MSDRSPHRPRRSPWTGKTSRREFLRWLAVASVAPGLLAACGGSGNGATTSTATTSGGAGAGTRPAGSPVVASGDPISIGVIAPLTGEVAVDGQLQKQGVDLGVEAVNAAGGVNGRPLNVIAEDGACDPVVSTTAAQKLITRDKVVLLEGAYCSSATAAIKPVSTRYKVPFVSALSTAADLTQGDNPWFSRFAPTEAIMSKQAVPVLKQALNMQKAAIITFNDDFGLSYAEANRANLEAAGVQVVSVDSFGSNTQDYSPFITKIKDNGADTVFVGADLGPTAALFKQMTQLGVTGINRVSAQVASSGEFVALATVEAAESIYMTTPYVPASPNPLNQAFVQAFQARYNKPPEAGAAGGYTSILLFADVLRRAGSLDGTAVQQAIRATDLDTPMGRLTFDGQGQGYVDFFLAQIRNSVPAVVQQFSSRG